MTAAKYQRILAGFQHGWAKLGNKRFDLVIFTPSHLFSNPDGSNNFPWNREKDYYIAEVRLPHTDETDNRDNFTLSGSAYVTHSPYDPLLSKLEPDFAKSCASFQKLCHHAGAALPEFMRQHLDGYCPWDCKSGASWWMALVAHARQLRVYNSAGVFMDRQTISRPWLDCIRLIELLKLNTDSPEWFDEPLPQDSRPNDGPLKPDGFCLNGEPVWGLAADWQTLLTFVWERRNDPPKWSDVATHLGVFDTMDEPAFSKLIYRINQKIKEQWPETLQLVRGDVVLRVPIRGEKSIPKKRKVIQRGGKKSASKMTKNASPSNATKRGGVRRKTRENRERKK